MQCRSLIFQWIWTPRVLLSKKLLEHPLLLQLCHSHFFQFFFSNDFCRWICFMRSIFVMLLGFPFVTPNEPRIYKYDIIHWWQNSLRCSCLLAVNYSFLVSYVYFPVNNSPENLGNWHIFMLIRAQQVEVDALHLSCSFQVLKGCLMFVLKLAGSRAMYIRRGARNVSLPWSRRYGTVGPPYLDNSKVLQFFILGRPDEPIHSRCAALFLHWTT